MFELVDAENTNAVIKVIGVGGGGGNAVEHMVLANLDHSLDQVIDLLGHSTW